MISVTLLQRSVAVQLDADTVISVVEDSKEVKKRDRAILSDKSEYFKRYDGNINSPTSYLVIAHSIETDSGQDLLFVVCQ